MERLEEVAREVKSVGRMLSFVLGRPDNKGRFEPTIERSSKEHGFAREMGFIETQLARAE